MSEHLAKAESSLAVSRQFPGTASEFTSLRRAVEHVIRHLRTLDSASALERPGELPGRLLPPPGPGPASSRVSENEVIDEFGGNVRYMAGEIVRLRGLTATIGFDSKEESLP